MAISSPSYETLNIVFVPMLAPGHFIPMIDLAKLIATRGVTATVILTPVVAARYQSSEPESIPIRFVPIPFPTQQVGLPEGCETADNLPAGQWANFGSALQIWQNSVEHFIEQMVHRFLPQIAGIAERLGLRRIIFDGMGCVNLLIIHKLQVSNILETIQDSDVPFVVPGLPHEIKITKEQLPGFVGAESAAMIELRAQIKAADLLAYGILINSFEELEPDYIHELRKIHNNRAWCVGPLSLTKSEKSMRGNKSTVDEAKCLKWLDSHELGSVVYVCFGSLTNLGLPQMAELGLALEASNRPFVWVVRSTDTKGQIEKWLSDNHYEEKTSGRGLILWGWVPQLLILTHKAVGAFVTHCGWNSIMEGISSGVPLITWPMFNDQFFNEKLLSQILDIGVSVGVVKASKVNLEVREMDVRVKCDQILKAIEKVMGGIERRNRVKKIGKVANKALEEGGSSYNVITQFLADMAVPQNII